MRQLDTIRVLARETPPDTQTDKRSGRTLADAWSSDASILVGTGLDDGLDAFGIETPRRSVSDDSGARAHAKSIQLRRFCRAVAESSRGIGVGSGQSNARCLLVLAQFTLGFFRWWKHIRRQCSADEGGRVAGRPQLFPVIR